MAATRVVRRLAILLACLLVFGATAAFAQHAAKGGNEVGVSGQQVAKDPATGKFRAPTLEELKILAPPANNESAEGLEVRILPNGARMVDLEGRFQSYSVATKDADGQLRTGCVRNAKDTEQFLKSDPSTNPASAPKKVAAQPQSDPSSWEVK